MDRRQSDIPVAWRFKERINGEFDSDWILTNYEPADGVRIIAKEPLYQVGGAHALIAENARLREALEQIAAIEDKLHGPDWEEIEEARKIAELALKDAP